MEVIDPHTGVPTSSRRHNIALVSAPAGFAFSFSTSITIPQNFPAAYYSIIVAPVGYKGWSI